MLAISTRDLAVLTIGKANINKRCSLCIKEVLPIKTEMQPMQTIGVMNTEDAGL